MVIMVATAVGGVVGMPVKGPFEQKHQKEAGQHPPHGFFDVAVELHPGVGQQVEHADTEQHTPGQRQEHLHRPMAEGQECQRRSPRECGG